MQERNNPVYLEVGAFLESEIMGVGGGGVPMQRSLTKEETERCL